MTTEEILKVEDIEKLKGMIDKGADLSKVSLVDLLDNKEKPNIDLVKFLIDNGVNINIQNEEGYTALMSACAHGYIEIVKILVTNGADVNMQDNEGYTALSTALDNPSVLERGFTKELKEIIEVLVENGIDVNLNPVAEMSVLTLVCVLGDIETVQLLIEYGADVNFKDENGLMPLTAIPMPIHSMEKFLHLSENIDKNKKKIIELLVENGADVNAKMEDGNSILFLACMFGNIEIIEHLIGLGADINTKIRDKMSILDMVLLMSEETFKLSSVDYNVTDMDVLFSNFEEKREDVARLLIKNGADVNCGIPDMSMLTMCAIDKAGILEKIEGTIEKKEALRTFISSMNFGDIKVAKFLIENGADINLPDSQGATPLMYACKTNNIEMVKLLVDSGADVNIEDTTGKNAYTYGKKNKDIARLLLSHGVTTNPSVEKRTKVERDRDIEGLERNKNENLKDSVQKHSYITPMTNVLLSKDVEQLRKLIDSGYDTSFVDLFDLVKEDYSLEFIQLIIKNGADINIVNKKVNITPLIVATLANKVEIVKLLVAYGVDVEWKNNKGKEAYDYAKNEEIIDILLNPAKYQTNLHRPKDLVRILTNFRKDSPIKYTTHDWDMGFKDEYGNFQVYLSKVKEQWDTIEEDLYTLSPRLHAKVYNFLINTDANCESWCSIEGDDISVGWSSLDGLEECCNEDNDPNKCKLDKTYKIGKKKITTLKTFGKVIKLFKQEIQIRRENDMLKNIFIDIAEQLYEEFNGLFAIKVIKLTKKQFYTDVEVFKNVLDIIFSEMKENRSHPNIKVEICEDPNDIYYDLKIIQIGSEAGKSANSMLNMSDGGSSSSIKSSLHNLCDWSIESSHEGDNYRINYLKNNTKREIEQLSYKPEGFTHILRFYR